MSEFSNQSVNMLGKESEQQQVPTAIGTHPMYRDEYMKNRQLIELSKKTTNQDDDDTNDLITIKYVGIGVTLVNIISENILSHPFQILRRQCQINPHSTRYHLTPFTLLPTIYHLHHHQGFTVLWKGLGSTLLVHGITLGIEDLLSKTTPWPKEIDSKTKIKDILRHLLLKTTSLVIIAPFYCASFVETVQSDIASEKPKLFEVFKEGFIRLFNWSGYYYQGRMLPVWIIILSTVTLGLTKYLFSLVTKSCIYRLLKFTNSTANSSSTSLKQKILETDLELRANLITRISTDLIFYPVDTIIYRLYLQGTRTIVDNLDDGRSVLPILTNYVGITDCYENCLRNEGRFGLYKGFGALILQYVVHCSLIRVTKFIFTEIVQLIRHKKIEKIQPISPDIISHLATRQHSYLLP